MTQPIGRGVRVVFWSVALLTGLTGLTMFFLPQLAGESLWPWRLSPLVSRYLGGLFIGIAVGALGCSGATQWGQVRPLFPPGLTFTGLSIIAALIHADVFNPARWATWLFFGLYVVVFMAGLVTYLQYERGSVTTASKTPTRVTFDELAGHKRTATA